MLRKLLAVLFLCGCAWAQSTTTVSGNIKNLGTGTVSTGSFVRFYLRGCAGNLPRINGTAIIAPTLGNVYYFDFAPNSSGAISGTLYSTRDATGLLGGAIECGGSTTAVWYGYVPFLNGKAGPETPIHAKASATIDISNVTPITTNPVITAPTGDGTYARLDSGNQPFTGAVTAQSVNGCASVGTGGYANFAAAETAQGTTGCITPRADYAGTDALSTGGGYQSGFDVRGSMFNVFHYLSNWAPIANFPLGGDLIFSGKAASDAYIGPNVPGIQAPNGATPGTVATTSSTSMTASVNVTITLATSVCVGGINQLSTSANILIAPFASDYESISSFTLTDCTHINLTPTKNHSAGVGITQQVGALHLAGQNITFNLPTPPGPALGHTRPMNWLDGDAHQDLLWEWPGNLADSFPFNSIRVNSSGNNAPLFSGMSYNVANSPPETNADLILTKNTSGNCTRFQGSSGNNAWNVCDTSVQPGVDILPSPTGSRNLGSTTAAFASLVLGTNGGTSGSSITSNATAVRSVVLPDAAITIPGNVTQSCGTAAAGSAANCSGNNTNISSSFKEVIGTTALVSGTPSQVTLTNLPTFGGTNTYVCTCTPVGTTAAIAAGGCAASNVSATSVTFTGPNTVSTVINYDCKGN